jgi:hypothetical protein
VNRIELETRIQNYLNNSIYYDKQSMDDSIQDGLDEICAFSGCIYKSAQLPFTQNTTYYDLLSLLPDYIGVVAIFNTVTKRWLTPSSLKKFILDRVDWDTAYGTPWFFCPISHRYIAIYQKPSAPNYGNFFIYYRAAAPQLDDTTQIPIPDEHITALESYCETDLFEQAQEFGKASGVLKTYMEDLKKLTVLMRNRRNPDRYVNLRG